MTRAYFLMILAYVLAGVAGYATLQFLPEMNIIWKVLIADVVATVVIFIFSITFKNSSFYDPYWSVIPIYIAVYLLAIAPEGVNSTRQLLVTGLITFWGIRLTYNFLKGWTDLHHEDWRYGMLKEKSGVFYPFVNFSGIHLFPTVIVFLSMVPVFPALLESSRPLGWIDIFAFLWTLGAILIELVSDEQLRKFRKERTDPSQLLNTGLWKYSRHPNYFGEIAFWWGLAFFGLAAVGHFEWWLFSGALAMTLMFVFISIPMLDKRNLERKPHYAEEMKIRSGLFPWFPKKMEEEELGIER